MKTLSTWSLCSHLVELKDSLIFLIKIPLNMEIKVLYCTLIANIFFRFHWYSNKLNTRCFLCTRPVFLWLWLFIHLRSLSTFVSLYLNLACVVNQWFSFFSLLWTYQMDGLLRQYPVFKGYHVELKSLTKKYWTLRLRTASLSFNSHISSFTKCFQISQLETISLLSFC